MGKVYTPDGAGPRRQTARAFENRHFRAHVRSRLKGLIRSGSFVFNLCMLGKVGDHTSVLAAEAAVAGGGFKDTKGGGVFAVDHVSAQITGEVG